jgi:hypothetical protein
VDYSVVEDTFTVADHLPIGWDYMEIIVPINENGQIRWTKVRITRSENGRNVEKTLTVEGNSQTTLHVQPWLEEKTLLSADPGYVVDEPIRHIGYTFQSRSNATVSLILQSP